MYDLASEQWLPRLPREQAALGYPSNTIVNTPRVFPHGDYVAYFQNSTSGSQTTVNLIVRTTDVTRRIVLYQPLEGFAGVNNQTYISWSPDNRWIAYINPQNDTTPKVVLAEVNAPHRMMDVPIVLRTNGGAIGWSADSQYLAVGDWEGVGQTFYILRVDDLQVVMISQHPQIDLSGGDRYSYWDDAQWSPKGNWFAYEMEQEDRSQLVLLSPERKSETIFDLSGNRAYAFSWSPQGNYIATLSYGSENGRLDIYGIDGTALYHVADHVPLEGCTGCLFLSVYWAADDASITYVDGRPSSNHVKDLITFWLKTNRYETISENLFKDPDLVGNGQWLSIDALIAPDMAPISNMILYSLPERRKITLSTSNAPKNETFSPDGRLAITWYGPNLISNPPTNEWQPGGSGLVWTRLSDGVLHTLEPTAKEVLFLNWAANSAWFTYLVALDGDGGETYLAIANTSTGESKHLSNIGISLSFADFRDDAMWTIPSPDGRYIALLENNVNGSRELRLIAVDGSSSRSITPLPGGIAYDIAYFVWSPNSARFAFATADPSEVYPSETYDQIYVFATDASLLKWIPLDPPYEQLTAFTQCGP